MANLTRRQWPRGWTPSADAINGNREGLLRMDNLHLDEDGVISLVRGRQKINTDSFPGGVHTCFSKTISNKKIRFVALTNGEIRRSIGEDFVTYEQVLTGGSSVLATFGADLGYIICSSGLQRKKCNGTTSYEITPETPAPPAVEVTSQPEVYVDFSSQSGENKVYDEWELWPADGSGESSGANLVNSGDYVQFDTGPTIGSVGVQPYKNKNYNTIIDGDTKDNDTFRMDVRIGHTDVLKSVEIVFFLQSPIDNGDGTYSNPDLTDYFKYIWEFEAGAQFTTGVNAVTNLSAIRRDFVRVGDDQTLGWHNITGVKVTINANEVAGEATAIANNLVTALRFQGSAAGPLTGTYDYAVVAVQRVESGYFKSALSESTRVDYVQNGVVNLTPPPVGDPQINEFWYFRRDSGISPDVLPLDTPRRLDKWYRVAVGEVGETVVDRTTDEEALGLNLWWNENLISLKDAIIDEILSIQTGVFGRTLYLTYKELLVSDINDFGLIDSSATIKLSGNVAEKNLWVKKPTLGIVYVGTSEDIYELSGTFNLLESGIVDVFSKGLGVGHPPISHQVAADENTVFYMASDGIRYVGGAENTVITQDIDLLFRGYQRHGVDPVYVGLPGTTIYALAISKGKLWASVPLMDADTRLHNNKKLLIAYDLKNKYWHPVYTDPISLCEDQDGELLAGYGGGSGNYLRQLDIGDDVDGSEGQSIHFETVYDDDGLPRNRKDSFTFKIVADSGGKNVTISIAKNGSGNFTAIGTTSFNGRTEKLITISYAIGLGKDFAIRITGDNLNTFKLYHFTIEYDARPEQLTYLRIPFTNLGTSSRKRFINFAFVIDTLGQTCEFFPLIDGAIAGASSVFSYDRKATHLHYFDAEQVGTDIGGIICGFFEYYGPNLDEIISEKMPVPATFLVIPQSDYGTPNRKRHSSYKFVINTRGSQVRFTPRLDGVNKTPMDFTTSEKQVVEYFFTEDTIGINIGGTLESIEDPKQPFEFYGPIVPQQVEILPPRLKEFRIPENNYGIAARKRVRTMPMEINTNGYPVTFTPIVDNVRYAPTVINTPNRTTAFHYFDFDIFGVDFSGELVGTNPFEFYGLMKPENVEVLPVAKKFDQIGPIRFDKVGKLQALRIRMISTGDSSIPLKILNENETTIPFMTGHIGEYSTSFAVTANKDDVYEILMPKTVNGTVFRIEIGPTIYPFHRYDIQAKVVTGGMDANPKWIKAQ
jgi:hypothetical protein